MTNNKKAASKTNIAWLLRDPKIMSNDIKARGANSFIETFRITEMYNSPVLSTGKNRSLSMSKFWEECRSSNPGAFDILFACPYLFRNGGDKITYLTLHCNLTRNEIMAIIDTWDEFRLYLYKHGLVATIFDGPEYGFMSSTANSLIIITRKKDLPYGSVLDNEVIRFVENGHRVKYLVFISLKSYKKEQIFGGVKIIDYGIPCDRNNYAPEVEGATYDDSNLIAMHTLDNGYTGIDMSAIENRKFDNNRYISY